MKGSGRDIKNRLINSNFRIWDSTAQNIGPEARKHNCKRKIFSGIVLILGSSVIRAPARKAGDPGSSPGPRYNFSLSILKQANRWPLSEN